MKTLNLFKASYLKLIPQLLLGSILIFSAISKVFSSDSFIINIGSTLGIKSESISLILTVLLIAVEIVLGIGLLLNIKTKLSIIAAGLLAFAFFIYNSFRIISGENSDCGCFGSFINTDNKQIIFIDLFLLLLVLFSIKMKEMSVKT